MSRKELSTREDLVAYLYNHKIPPSAIIRPINIPSKPMCVHTFRVENYAFFEETIKETWSKEVRLEAWDDSDEYPSQSHTCMCQEHTIRDSKEHCTEEIEA